MPRIILTQAQAEAVHAAMRALEKAGFNRMQITRAGLGGLEVTRRFDGAILVERFDSARFDERYPDQTAFATAYGLSIED